jgi:hypothetical protein
MGVPGCGKHLWQEGGNRRGEMVARISLLRPPSVCLWGNSALVIGGLDISCLLSLVSFYFHVIYCTSNICQDPTNKKTAHLSFLYFYCIKRKSVSVQYCLKTWCCCTNRRRAAHDLQPFSLPVVVCHLLALYITVVAPLSVGVQIGKIRQFFKLAQPTRGFPISPALRMSLEYFQVS